MRRPAVPRPRRSAPAEGGARRRVTKPRPIRLRMPSRREAVAPTVDRILEAVAPVSPRCVVVEVSDSGGGFDAGGISDPTLPERQLAPSGRGIFLMRCLVD